MDDVDKVARLAFSKNADERLKHVLQLTDSDAVAAELAAWLASAAKDLERRRLVTAIAVIDAAKDDIDGSGFWPCYLYLSRCDSDLYPLDASLAISTWQGRLRAMRPLRDAVNNFMKRFKVADLYKYSKSCGLAPADLDQFKDQGYRVGDKLKSNNLKDYFYPATAAPSTDHAHPSEQRKSHKRTRGGNRKNYATLHNGSDDVDNDGGF